MTQELLFDKFLVLFSGVELSDKLICLSFGLLYLVGLKDESIDGSEVGENSDISVSSVSKSSGVRISKGFVKFMSKE